MQYLDEKIIDHASRRRLENKKAVANSRQPLHKTNTMGPFAWPLFISLPIVDPALLP